MRSKGAFSLTEVLVALGILALVLCGALVLLQTNLMFYRRQITGLRAALVGQAMLAEPADVPSGGQVGDLNYTMTTDETGHWLHLRLGPGSQIYCEQTLWRLGTERGLIYQNFDTLRWTLADSESCAEQILSEEDAIPWSDGRHLSWRGAQVYEGCPQAPQLSPDQRKLAFLQDGQVWVLDLNSRRAACWLGGPAQSLAWHDRSSLIATVQSQILKVSAQGIPQVLYDGPLLSQAAVSPDAKQIAYVGRLHETNDLCLYDRASGSSQLIMATPEGEIRPLWSRDGRRILYGVAPEAGGTRLKCINPDGSGLQDLGIVASASNWKWR
ncbi:MAG: prepilin-type N-terminal cleavage/methylation domain-containing protein [Vulcanimicrobiota bacterium]